MTGKILDSNKVKDFIFAGNATFTIKNSDTGNRFTFKVKKIDKDKSFIEKELWFVSVLTGSCNETNYSFIGTCFQENSFKYSPKSNLNEDAQSLKVWKWFQESVIRNWLVNKPQIEVWHEGKCGKCGRKLTVPESIEQGFGPECIKVIAA